MTDKELLDRIEALEEQVARLTKLVPGAEVENTEGKEKRCLPGFNECKLV